MLGTQLKIATRSLLRNRRKTLISFLAVSVGSAAIILAGGFFNYIFYALSMGAIYGELGHLQVSAPGFIEKGVVAPFEYTIPDFALFNERYSQLPQVRFILPRISFSGLINYGDTTGSFIGFGVDPEKEHQMVSSSLRSGPAIRIIQGRALEANDKNAIVLGMGLATSIGAKAGDALTLLSNTESGSIGGVTVTVVGIFESFQKEFDDRALQLPLATAQTLLGIGNKVQKAIFILENNDAVTSVHQGLKQAFGERGEQYEIREWKSLAFFYNATVALFQRMFLVVNIVIGLVVILGIANSISMSIFERTREIGTVMAIGTKPNQVVMQYVLEGVLLGIFGGLAGVLIGALLAQLVSFIGIPMPPAPGGTRPWIGMITPSLYVYIKAFLTAALSGIVASVYPAIRASRLQIVQALRQT